MRQKREDCCFNGELKSFYITLKFNIYFGCALLRNKNNQAKTFAHF